MAGWRGRAATRAAHSRSDFGLARSETRRRRFTELVAAFGPVTWDLTLAFELVCRPAAMSIGEAPRFHRLGCLWSGNVGTQMLASAHPAEPQGYQRDCASPTRRCRRSREVLRVPTRSHRLRRLYCPPPSALVFILSVGATRTTRADERLLHKPLAGERVNRISSPTARERRWVSSLWLAGGRVPESSARKCAGGSKREVSKGAIGKMVCWQQRIVQTVVGP